MPNLSLSFDDSRKDFYTNVFPLLKRYNIPATLNVITARILKTELGDDSLTYMTIPEVKECADSGLVEIASHSANHKNEANDCLLSIMDLKSWGLDCYGGSGGGGVR